MQDNQDLLVEKPEVAKEKSQFRNYANSERQERVQNFYKVQHTNQDYETVLKLRDDFGKFNRKEMSIWGALEYLNNLVDDSDPDTDLSQIQHCMQAAEACRKLYPDEKYDWFWLTGLIHDLGKIMVLTDNLPQWATVGDTHPVGCKFSDKIVFSEYFKLNKDFDHPVYSTELGIYEKGCGIQNLQMSWGHDEYMYMVCKANECTLPDAALYIIRYHSFYAWHRENEYSQFNNTNDIEGKEWVLKFNPCDLYSKADAAPSMEEIARLKPMYQKIAEKYFPSMLKW